MITTQNHRWVGSLAHTLTLAITLLAGCQARFDRAHHWAEGRNYMVAADHIAASRAGAQILAAGGNAVDAAVATSFALAVVRPESCGLGGGGFMLIHRPGRPPVVLDYRESAPNRAIRKAYLDEQGRPIKDKTRYGAWAVGVPGTVRGLLQAFQTYGSGRLSRQQILQPAIDLARRGFAADRHLHDAMKNLADSVRRRPQARRRFDELCHALLHNGEPIAIGQHVDRSDMVWTLQTIAQLGGDSFYSGPIARKIIQEMQRRCGPLSGKDLKTYQVRTLEPLIGRFKGFDILAMPPPSSGGAVIFQILNTLAAGHRDLAQLAAQKNGLYEHLLTESMKHAFANRAHFLGVRSPEVMNDVARMVAPQYGVQVWDRIDPDRTFPLAAYGMQTVPDDGGTSHFCVTDSQGMAVACTESINTEFGSRILIPKTGIILNNTLDDFAIDTTTPNSFGLRQSRRNIIRPGARPLSSMSPTIVLKNGRVVLVVGASGGPRIISATLQTLLHVLIEGKTVDQAIAAPRLHHQWRPDVLWVQSTIPDSILRGLLRRGHKLRFQRGASSHVQAIQRLPDGKWRGASDPDKGGQPIGR